MNETKQPYDPIAVGPHAIHQLLVKALGLDGSKVRSLTLHAEVRKAVTLTVERFVGMGEIEKVVMVLKQLEVAEPVELSPEEGKFTEDLAQWEEGK